MNKRTVAHALTSSMAILILIALVLRSTSVALLIWSIPFILSNCAMIILLTLSVLNKPREVSESLPMFLVSVVSANLPILVGFTDHLLPMGATVGWLVELGKALTLVVMPFYLLALLTLGRRFTILPEADSLQTGGVYRISRHPLYATYVYWYLIQNLIFQSWSAVVLSILQIALIVFRARREEEILDRNFPEYRTYKAQVWWIGRRTTSSLHLQ